MNYNKSSKNTYEENLEFFTLLLNIKEEKEKRARMEEYDTIERREIYIKISSFKSNIEDINYIRTISKIIKVIDIIEDNYNNKNIIDGEIIYSNDGLKIMIDEKQYNIKNISCYLEEDCLYTCEEELYEDFKMFFKCSKNIFSKEIEKERRLKIDERYMPNIKGLKNLKYNLEYHRFLDEQMKKLLDLCYNSYDNKRKLDGNLEFSCKKNYIKYNPNNSNEETIITEFPNLDFSDYTSLRYTFITWIKPFIGYNFIDLDEVDLEREYEEEQKEKERLEKIKEENERKRLRKDNINKIIGSFFETEYEYKYRMRNTNLPIDDRF